MQPDKLAGIGIQPIAGIQLSVCFESPEPTQRTAAQAANLVLLAQSEEGYRNLMRLASRAYFDVPLGDMPRIMAPVLAGHRDGLIALARDSLLKRDEGEASKATHETA